MADDNGTPTPTPTPAPTPAPTAAPVRNETEAERNLRAEAAAHRIAKNAAEDRAEKLAADLVKAQAESDKRIKDAESPLLSKLEKQNQRIMNSELKSAAVAAGLRDVDLLPLIKMDGIKIDDEGNVTGVEEAIAAFKESKPVYFADDSSGSSGKGGKGDEGKGGTGATGSTGSKKTAPAAEPKTPPANVSKMDGKDYAAAKRAAVAKLRA